MVGVRADSAHSEHPAAVESDLFLWVSSFSRFCYSCRIEAKVTCVIIFYIVSCEISPLLLWQMTFLLIYVKKVFSFPDVMVYKINHHVTF